VVESISPKDSLRNDSFTVSGALCLFIDPVGPHNIDEGIYIEINITNFI
jgi:hypothetical protein